MNSTGRAWVAVAAFFAIAVGAHSCGLYHTTLTLQETERMRVCINGGGKWIHSWGVNKCEWKP